MSGSIDAAVARKLVDYVAANPGRTIEEVEVAVPELKDIPDWFEVASEGAKNEDGFIIKSVNGKIEPGPIANLIGTNI